MNSQQPDSFDEQLSAYLDGELDDADRRRVEQALETDADARAALHRLRQTTGALKGLPRLPAPPSLVGDILSRVERDHLLNDPRTRGQRGSFSFRRLYPLLAAAAMIAIAGTVGLWGILQSDRTADRAVVIATTPADVPAADENTTPLVLGERTQRTAGIESESRPGMKSKSETAVDSASDLGIAAKSSSMAPTTPTTNPAGALNGSTTDPAFPTGLAASTADIKSLGTVTLTVQTSNRSLDAMASGTQAQSERTIDSPTDASAAFVLEIFCNSDSFLDHSERLASADPADKTDSATMTAAAQATVEPSRFGPTQWGSPNWYSTGSQRVVERIVTLPRDQLPAVLAAIVADGAAADSVTLSAGGILLASGSQDALQLASIVAGVDRVDSAGDAPDSDKYTQYGQTFADTRRNGPLDRFLQQLAIPPADRDETIISTAGTPAPAAAATEVAGTGGASRDGDSVRGRGARVPSTVVGDESRPSDAPSAEISPESAFEPDTTVYGDTAGMFQSDDANVTAGGVKARDHVESRIVLRIRLIGPPLVPPPGEPGRLSPR
ncbi:MAG: hypothetical protein HOP29_03940 [Phycisphaerales bacterium]|nr:hypothetical protein [Phycisphaerales bacterium]